MFYRGAPAHPAPRSALQLRVAGGKSAEQHRVATGTQSKSTSGSRVGAELLISPLLPLTRPPSVSPNRIAPVSNRVRREHDWRPNLTRALRDDL
jgi:hypothetical protein